MTYDELRDYILKMGWIMEVNDFSAMGLGFEIIVKQHPTKTCECCGQQVYGPVLAFSDGDTLEKAQQQLVEKWDV